MSSIKVKPGNGGVPCGLKGPPNAASAERDPTGSNNRVRVVSERDRPVESVHLTLTSTAYRSGQTPSSVIVDDHDQVRPSAPGSNSPPNGPSTATRAGPSTSILVSTSSRCWAAARRSAPRRVAAADCPAATTIDAPKSAITVPATRHSTRVKPRRANRRPRRRGCECP